MGSIRIIVFSVIVLTFSALSAQNNGDTIVVNVLDYQNPSRDVIAPFSQVPSISFEKVIMRYAMRCKSGLVSSVGDRNRGCGEWDYSCNTYITDSTSTDSTLSSIDRYSIFPDTNTSGLYSSTPTWIGSPTIQTDVEVLGITAEDTATIGQGTLLDSTILKTDGSKGKAFVLLTAAELTTAGLDSGDINGFNFINNGDVVSLKNFRVKAKTTTLQNLAYPDSAEYVGLQEVYYHNYNAEVGRNRVQFYTPFSWDGTSNILLELSYKTQSGSGQLKLQSHSTPVVQTISSMDDLSFNLFPSNYIQTTGYKGIASNNDRTIEAWIKTTVAGKEIASWGTNSAGQKFSFRLDGMGKLRLEVNGAYIVGETAINDGNWHHVALAFSGSSLYNVRLMVDGNWDRFSTIQSTTMNTGQTLDFQISKGFHNRYWEGNIDDVRMWSAKLSDSTISDWRYRQIDSSHPNYSDLGLDYSINSESSTVADNSVNGRNGEFKGVVSFSSEDGVDHFKSFSVHTNRPNIELYQGTYSLNVVNDTVVDTTYATPYSVTSRTVFSKAGTIYSDSIGVVVSDYWPSKNQLFDLNGNLVSSSTSADTVRFQNSVLNYYRRNASKVEIMSFVTPYGINLDLGMEGKAWYFDVTDFLPILKGDQRLTIERGGQNQEEMDISFLFIVGTPPREVKDIKQIWKVDSRNYSQIMSDAYFEPVTVALDTSASQYKIRSIITGHGQQGEFIPRNHFMNINGGAIEFNWQVWKECPENPVFPQGGTWIYNRAGWCPGMATDVNEFNITSLIGSASTVDLDYGVTSGSGDSRYIVNNQLVSYGPPNFNLDARINAIISPSDRIEYGRINPVCDGAKIMLQNTGSTPITSAVIEYSINSGIVDSYTWSGSLDFMEEVEVSLPTSNQFWESGTIAENLFTASIITVNGISDEYSLNNIISNSFDLADLIPKNFYVQFETNNAAFESSYDVRDSSGAILFQRSGMSNSRVYRDTFNLTTGCYSFNVYDSDNDGIDFFGNNDGVGSVRINEVGGRYTQVFEPDFGDNFSFNFTVKQAVGIDELKLGHSVSLFPNPSNSVINVETTGLKGAQWEIRNSQGQMLKSGTLTSNHIDQFSLDVSDFAVGIYFIKMNTTKVSEVQRFVISK